MMRLGLPQNLGGERVPTSRNIITITFLLSGHPQTKPASASGQSCKTPDGLLGKYSKSSIYSISSSSLCSPPLSLGVPTMRGRRFSDSSSLQKGFRFRKCSKYSIDSLGILGNSSSIKIKIKIKPNFCLNYLLSD